VKVATIDMITVINKTHNNDFFILPSPFSNSFNLLFNQFLINLFLRFVLDMVL